MKIHPSAKPVSAVSAARQPRDVDGWNDLIDAEILSELEPRPARELLQHALADERPPTSRKVFTNRALRMQKIRYIGFDLDWTLANYDLEAMSEIAFQLTLERMVHRHGYPKSILQSEYRPHFTRRGLMIDKEAGTVLKMNRHRYVGRAYHGRKFLDADERARLYRQEPIHPASDRFYIVDTLFELPEINIFSEVIELERKRKLRLESYAQLFKDIRGAIDTIHADGSLKEKILSDLERYLPHDPNLNLALQRLGLGGRKLLLITNSEWFYSAALCAYLFENGLPGSVPRWQELFDLVVVDAGKPGFFRKGQPFMRLDSAGEAVATEPVPRWGGVYAGGSREGILKLLAGPGEQMLYVGDHIYGDIFSSKRTSTWRTALILQELESELTIRLKLGSEHRRLEILRAELADFGQRMDDLNDVLVLYRTLLAGVEGGGDDLSVLHTERYLTDLRNEHRVMRQHSRRLQERISRALNPYWGSVFKQGSNKSLFGSQVDDFACIYTSRVSNFASYGRDHYYRVLRDHMMHESEM